MITMKITIKAIALSVMKLFHTLKLFITSATMKVFGCVLLILFLAPLRWADHSEALSFVLKAIEYLSSKHMGVFSCVFYDISLSNPFDNILNDLLVSPRLDHVVKYLVNVTFQKRLEDLPWHPTLLIVNPGPNSRHYNDYLWNITKVLELFDPNTNMLVFMNESNKSVRGTFENIVNYSKYSYIVYLDISTMILKYYNGVWFWFQPKPSDLAELFNYGRNWMKGRNVTYIVGSSEPIEYLVYRWISEVAYYLSTELVEFPHNCIGSGREYDKCMVESRSKIEYTDILLDPQDILHMERLFSIILTSYTSSFKFLVPRGRSVNSFELMLMPFTFQVWILLVTILISMEITKCLFPELFRNDPTLLVVCGFERHNLHLAGRWEKTIFLSLIIMMFFLTSAFETKIVSLIISRPSIQRIKTLEDLYNSGLKMYFDLENFPEFLEHPLFGKLTTQGSEDLFGELNPGKVMLVDSHNVNFFIEINFDYDRMEPFYEALDYEWFGGISIYRTSTRSILREAFRRVEVMLIEAGIFDFWKRGHMIQQMYTLVGRRFRVDSAQKLYLKFGDIKIAWLILVFGLAIATIAFLGEFLTHKLPNFRIWLGLFLWHLRKNKGKSAV